MSLVDFQISTSPEKPVVNLRATMDAKSLTFSVVPPIDVSLSISPSTPTRVMLDIFSLGTFEIAVKAIQDAASSRMRDFVNDLQTKSWTVDFGSPLGFSVNVAGVDVHVAANTVSLSTFNGMLMAEGTVKVS
jgi:hypothetical protein